MPNAIAPYIAARRDTADLVAQTTIPAMTLMPRLLPDVARLQPSAVSLPLRWVGMRNIALPLQLRESGRQLHLPARARVEVDLPDPTVRGIHMSRLYRLLDAAAEQPITAAALHALLQAMIDSHADCAASAARVRLKGALLLRRPALMSPGLAGWRRYPVRLEAALIDSAFTGCATVDVAYSSTCPCSAALARQLVRDAFVEAHAGGGPLSAESVAEWIAVHGSMATPHSQRSRARVRVALPLSTDDPGVIALIDATETALGTPVQTAVKRIDEQAFARLNGENLMYVEDAARRIQAALAGRWTAPRVRVRHFESLHPHDAVAEAG